MTRKHDAMCDAATRAIQSFFAGQFRCETTEWDKPPGTRVNFNDIIFINASEPQNRQNLFYFNLFCDGAFFDENDLIGGHRFTRFNRMCTKLALPYFIPRTRNRTPSQTFLPNTTTIYLFVNRFSLLIIRLRNKKKKIERLFIYTQQYLLLNMQTIRLYNIPMCTLF